MRSVLIRSLPLVSLAINFPYLLYVFVATNVRINENYGSFNEFLNQDGRWGKYAVRRRPDGPVVGQSKNGSSASLAGDDVARGLFYILDWTSFYRLPMTDDYLMRECPLLPCRLTSDRRLLQRSAAVIFHPPNIRTFDWPLWRSPFQSYVFAMWESPTSVVDVGWVNLRKYGGLFNLTMTYRYDSDVPAPYGHITKLRTIKKADEFNEELRRLIKKKSKLVALFVSHCSTSNEREKFVEELKKHVPVDIYGYCGSLKCERGSCDERRLLGQYKFYLSFENSNCKDYVTEKFYERLLQDVVPVVLGGGGNFVGSEPRYPRRGFITATNFSSVKELADYLLYLDSHPEEYAEYFRWKLHYEAVMSWTRLFERAYCQLCRRLMWLRDDFAARRQSYNDIYYWWHEKYVCDDGLVARFLKKSR